MNYENVQRHHLTILGEGKIELVLKYTNCVTASLDEIRSREDSIRRESNIILYNVKESTKTEGKWMTVLLQVKFLNTVWKEESLSWIKF